MVNRLQSNHHQGWALSRENGWTWPVVLLTTLVIVAADVGIASSYDAVFLACAIGMRYPRLLLGMMIVLVSLQDAPGASGVSWYLGVSALFLIAFVQHLAALKRHIHILSRPPEIIFYAFLLVLYGTLISAIFAFFDGPLQDSSRPFLVIGCLMIINIWSAYYLNFMIALGKIQFRDFIPSTWIVLIHFLLLLLAQLIFDPSFLAAPIEGDEASQLITSTALGFPRLTAQFTSPNTMGLFFILIFLVLFEGRVKWDLNGRWVAFWCICGSFVAVAALSKAIILLFLSIFVFLSIKKLGWVISGLIGFTLFQIAGYVLADSLLSILLDSFRISNELSGSSLRSLTWAAVVNNFTAFNWIYGTGFSFWPHFIEQHVGVRLSDPHSFVLSVPGTFGLPGVLFYLFLIKSLLKTAYRAPDGKKFAVVILVTIFLVRDLFGIPYIFGNTPITFLIWFVLIRTLHVPSPALQDSSFIFSKVNSYTDRAPSSAQTNDITRV